MNDDDINKFNQFSLHFEADCVPNNVMLPTTVKEMIPFMSNMQKFIEKDNNGKGTQIQYYLFPLSKVKEIMSFEISTNKIISLIEISTINKLEEEFDNFEKQKQKFYQLEESIESLSLFLPEEKSNQLKSKKKEIEQTELNFKSKIKFFYLLNLFEYFLSFKILAKLQEILPKVRKGEKDCSQIQHLVNDFQKQEGYTARIKEFNEKVYQDWNVEDLLR